MKKNSTIIFVKIIFVALLIATIFTISFNKKSTDKNTGEEKEKYDGILLAQQLEFEKTKDPATGTVPRERLFEAMRRTEELKQSFMRTMAFGVWTERGPNSDVVGG